MEGEQPASAKQASDRVGVGEDERLAEFYYVAIYVICNAFC